MNHLKRMLLILCLLPWWFLMVPMGGRTPAERLLDWLAPEFPLESSREPPAAELRLEHAQTVAAGTGEVQQPGQDDGALHYCVIQGDTVERLAKLFLTSEQDLRRINGWSEDPELIPGEYIRIPGFSLD